MPLCITILNRQHYQSINSELLFSFCLLSGKPELLRHRHSISGYWSRCISDEHRLVYKLSDESLLIAQLWYQSSNNFALASQNKRL
ncbi:type II toxin-antitoxin system YoeB family toxin [Methylophaga muralis]|uniref:Toxin YoeB n=1 Tax=Methylophaga muralis TaxID=291169 RepID=A0A1E3GSF5_9GAMM|nr:type II toxin-antitoxin system YoeB family toxin [Methylophaga muralis]ODN66865.1 Toxin YoeB [Methylophaga muralis]